MKRPQNEHSDTGKFESLDNVNEVRTMLAAPPHHTTPPATPSHPQKPPTTPPTTERRDKSSLGGLGEEGRAEESQVRNPSARSPPLRRSRGWLWEAGGGFRPPGFAGRANSAHRQRKLHNYGYSHEGDFAKLIITTYFNWGEDFEYTPTRIIKTILRKRRLGDERTNRITERLLTLLISLDFAVELFTYTCAWLVTYVFWSFELLNVSKCTFI